MKTLLFSLQNPCTALFPTNFFRPVSSFLPIIVINAMRDGDDYRPSFLQYLIF